MVSKKTATSLLKTYMSDWQSNFSDMSELDRWARGKLNQSDMPTLQNPSREYRELRDRSHTPWLGLVITATAQSLYVDGYRGPKEADDQPAWEAWKRNGMKARQIAVHRGALGLGHSYLSVLPGDPVPVMRGHSARRMVAYYEDLLNDDWPIYALESETVGTVDGKKVRRWKLWDEDGIHWFDKREGDDAAYVTYQQHGLGYVPIVQFSNVRDLDGRTMGEAEAYRDLVARIDQDNFDRLVVQRFNAWLLRWISGMELPAQKEDPETGELVEDVDANRAFKAKLAAEDILVAEDPNARFGAFPQGQITAYVDAREADISDLAAVSQTPPHHLLGKVANLSAEALAAAEAGLTRKVTERKQTFGESWEQALRATSLMMEGDEDFDAEVRWRDTESRSLAQVADALGKLTTSLGIPPQALWERVAEVLGVSQSEVERWQQMAEDADPLAGMASQIMGGMDDADVSAELKTKFDALGVAIRAGVDPQAAASLLGLEGVTFTGAIPTSLRPRAEDATGLEG